MDLNSNGFNQSAGLPDLRTLRTSIANPTDFFFPVYGFQDQTHFAKEFGYHGLVESPGMAFVINTNSQDDMPNAVLMNIFSCWPVVTLFMVVTYVAGLAVWAVVSQNWKYYNFGTKYIHLFTIYIYFIVYDIYIYFCIYKIYTLSVRD